MSASLSPPSATHTDLLNPPLPYDMAPRAARALGDIQLQQFVNAATTGKDRARRAAFAETFGDRYDALRHHAGSIKQHTLDHLDRYLRQWIERATAAGIQVHLADDATTANAICIQIAQRHGSKLCVKSKSMVTEETRLVPALQAAGIETIETDLGEFILQLDGDAPSHIVTPMIHKDRTAVGRAFAQRLGVAYTDDPVQLTQMAREHLRQKYQEADLGISGGNFLIAETGSVVLCTNEGNGRFCTSVPPVHIAVVGIEKLIPRMEHLSVFLKLLARSSTAQPLTCYTSILTGPRRLHEPDGPREMHVVLLDNGRTELLRTETRELLRCIRCGACLNACPVYRKIGGHAYGAVYSGPIGAVITPLLNGVANYPDLPQASSLCGACYEACPVAIDIPSHLIRLRAELASTGMTSNGWRWLMRAWSFILRHPKWYRLAMRAIRLPAWLARGSSPMATAWLSRLPQPLSAWTDHRDLPLPDAFDFRTWWKQHTAARSRVATTGDSPDRRQAPGAYVHKATPAREAVKTRGLDHPRSDLSVSVLDRVDAALGRETRRESMSAAGDGAGAPAVADALARTCHTGDDLVATFTMRATAVGMQVHRVQVADAARCVTEVLSSSASRIALRGWEPAPRHDAIEQCLRADGWTIQPVSLNKTDTFAASAGLTSTSAAVAETGTLVLVCNAHASRCASLAPPVHVALLPASRIVPDLLDAWTAIGCVGPAIPSSQVVLITGPSKTADIEGVLIRGVHGPRDVHVILLTDA